MLFSLFTVFTISSNGTLYINSWFIMNTIGLSIIMRMGCLCSKEVITINNQKFYVVETLGEG